MAIKFSQLDPIGELSKNDLFAVTKYDGQVSKSCTAKNISDFVGSNSNGGFRGTTNKLNMTLSDVGVWWYAVESGGDGPAGLLSGMIELIGSENPNDNPQTYNLIQRFTFGVDTYIRSKIANGAWTQWTPCNNTNGAVIIYGNSNEETVTFPTAFAGIPSVTVTPTNTTTDKMYFINLVSVTAGQFTVRKFKSPLATSQTTTETGSTTKTETTDSSTTTDTSSSTTVTTIGAWEVDSSIPFDFIAIYEPGSRYTTQYQSGT